jgi:hypothetical protein
VGSSLSSSDQKCLGRCMDRYQDVSGLWWRAGGGGPQGGVAGKHREHRVEGGWLCGVRGCWLLRTLRLGMQWSVRLSVGFVSCMVLVGRRGAGGGGQFGIHRGTHTGTHTEGVGEGLFKAATNPRCCYCCCGSFMLCRRLVLSRRQCWACKAWSEPGIE